MCTTHLNTDLQMMTRSVGELLPIYKPCSNAVKCLTDGNNLLPKRLAFVHLPTYTVGSHP